MDTTAGIEARAAAVIREYDAQGWHRTGTAVDLASAEWLAAKVREAGLEPALERFVLDRVDIHEAALTVSGRRIEGVPLFDAAFTAAGGVTGALGPPGSDAAIGVAVADAGEGGDLVDARRSTKHQAIVAVVRGRAPGLTLRNAPDIRRPFGPPVLQVDSTEGEWLEAAARAGATATVVAHASRVPSYSRNVAATIPGSDSALTALCVMTPRSGWWNCASERGGGLVCWLETMGALAASRPERTVHLVASSGHELGHLGLDAYLEAHPGLDLSAHAWVHFGANIGAAGDSLLFLTASNHALRESARRSFAAAGAREPALRPPGFRPPGESRNIHDAGGQYVSFVAPNDRFHMREDRWPEAVDLGAVAAYARGSVRLAIALAG
jgi:hypothetical protein